MIQVPLSELFDFLQKSKIKAGSGRDTGKYPFFTSSEKQSKFLDDYEYEPPCLIFGTGGNASVHLAITGFSTSTDCLVMTPRERVAVDPNYTYRFLAGNIQLLQAGFKGAGLKHISKKYIADIRIPLPPLAEQKRVAKILDAAEALRAKRRETLAQLDTLLQSTFLDMFGDPVTNPMEWDTAPLDEVTVKITDGTHKTPKYKDSGVEFLSAKDLKDGEIRWGTGKFISAEEHAQLVKRCNPEPGDLLLAKSGSLGSVAIIDRDHEFSLFESLCLIKRNPEKIDAPFLACMIRNPTMQVHLLGKNKGVAIKHLHLVDVRGLRILIPPLEQQHRFAAIVESVERQKARMRAHLAELDALFASLQSRAFNGEL